MDENKIVLCGANAYEKKYYFNEEQFKMIPDSIKQELHVICVLFTEEVGGVFTIAFEEDGNVVMETNADDDDIYYDEISSGLLISEIRRSRQELFESLSLYYRVFIKKKMYPHCWMRRTMNDFVIDVGNTNMTMGVFQGKKMEATFRIMTKTPRTSDEYGIMITQLLKNNGIEVTDIEGAIIASVVPDVMHSLTSSIIRYLKTKPLIVGPGVKSGIKVATEDPRAIGADRIVDAVAAYVKYGGPVLVLDFGTATTYDLITEDGRFTAGITAPGIRISSEALWKETAKLPNIEIRKPKTILAQETITSMQAGLMYGQIGQTEYIIRKVKEESGLAELKVVATGGLGRAIADETDSIDIYDSSLTLDGLRIIYDKNRR